MLNAPTCCVVSAVEHSDGPLADSGISLNGQAQDYGDYSPSDAAQQQLESVDRIAKLIRAESEVDTDPAKPSQLQLITEVGGHRNGATALCPVEQSSVSAFGWLPNGCHYVSERDCATEAHSNTGTRVDMGSRLRTDQVALLEQCEPTNENKPSHSASPLPATHLHTICDANDNDTALQDHLTKAHAVECSDAVINDASSAPSAGGHELEFHDAQEAYTSANENEDKIPDETDEDWRSALSPIELSSARVVGPVMRSLDDVFTDVRQQAEAYYEEAIRTSEQRGEPAADDPCVLQVIAQIDAICSDIAASKRRFEVSELCELSTDDQQLVNAIFEVVLPRAEKIRTQTRVAAAVDRLVNRPPLKRTLALNGDAALQVSSQADGSSMAGASGVQSSAAANNGEKRRRGRKPKNRAPDVAVEQQLSMDRFAPVSSVQPLMLATPACVPQLAIAATYVQRPFAYPPATMLTGSDDRNALAAGPEIAVASGEAPVKRRGRKKKAAVDTPASTATPPATHDGQLPPADGQPPRAKRGRKKKNQVATHPEDAYALPNGAKYEDAETAGRAPSNAANNILEMAMPTGIVLDERGEVNVIGQAVDEPVAETKKRRAAGGRKAGVKAEAALVDQSACNGTEQPPSSYSAYASQASRMAEYDYNLHVAQQQQQQQADSRQPIVGKRGAASHTQPDTNGATTTSASSMTSGMSQKGNANAASPSTASTSAQARDIIDEYLEDLSLLQDRERMQQANVQRLVPVGGTQPPSCAAPQDVNAQPVPPPNAVALPQQAAAAPVAVGQQPPASAMQLFTLWPGGTVIETPADSALAAIAAYNDLYSQRPGAAPTAQPQRVAVNMNMNGAQPNFPNGVGQPHLAQPIPAGMQQQQVAAYCDPYAYSAANRLYTTAYSCDPALLAVATRLHPGAAYAYDAAYLMATLNAAGVAGAGNQSAPDGSNEASKTDPNTANNDQRSFAVLNGKYSPLAPATQPGVTVAMVQPQQSPQFAISSMQHPATSATVVSASQNDPYRMATDFYSQMSNPNNAYLYTTAARDPIAAAYAGLAGQRLAAAAAVLNATATGGTAAGAQLQSQQLASTAENGAPQPPNSNANPNGNAASVRLSLNVNVNQNNCGAQTAAGTQPTSVDPAAQFLSPPGTNYFWQPGTNAMPNGVGGMLGGQPVNAGFANGAGQQYTFAAYPAQAAAAYMQAAAVAGQKYRAGTQQQAQLLVSPSNVGGAATGQLQLGVGGAGVGGSPQLAQQAPVPGADVQQGAQDYFRAAAALYSPADAYQGFMMNRYY